MAYQQVSDGDASTTSGQESRERNWKKVKVPSSADLIVYDYDINTNRYKPYMADDIKLGEDFPQREINKMFEEISTNVSRPPKINRVLYGSPGLTE